MGRSATVRVEPARVLAWLRTRYPDADLVALRPLGKGAQAGLKDYGYGRPLRITFTAAGRVHDIVLRTMAPDPFGHHRRADRVAEMVLSYDTFGAIPRHIRPAEVGAFTPDGDLRPLPDGEPYLVTEFVEGRLYADDLHRLAPADEAPEPDLARAEALARYLADLHRAPARPVDYTRAVRDLLGGGEGIFGLCDSYPADHPVATPARLRAIEHLAVDWRWRLRPLTHRARRTHGDFHPFNLLFRAGTDLSVLDCSRGAAGDPADDLTCLSINYLFFALVERGAFVGALRALWDRFWTTWADAAEDAAPEDVAPEDTALYAVVAPYFAWRGLVVASPVWYPRVDDATRDRLLRFVERLLEGAPFHPRRVDDLLG
jgi:hypothetical protein